MTYNFDNYEKDTLTKPRDEAWENWMKFENVGDKVQGFIRDVFYRAADGAYAAARGITLEQPTGELINVRVKHVDFILNKTNELRLNDPLTIVFEKEIPAKKKGYNATKVLGFYGTNLPENASEMTVLELENKDRKIAEAEAEAEAEADSAALDAVAEPVVPFE